MSEFWGPPLNRRRLLVAAGATAAAFPIVQWRGTWRALAAPAEAEGLTLATFTPHVGTRFEAGDVALVLDEAVPREPHPLDRPALQGESFSLIFAGARPRQLEHGTYTLRHPAIGRVSLFLVPVGAGRRRQEYEAVVDRRIPAR